MPRQARLDAPGALHHVIARGVGRGAIFSSTSDREVFLDYLGIILTETKTSCFAWCLMSNHIHLLLRTGERPLGKIMQRVLTRYALYHNRRNHRPGHLFQNRYKAILCEEEPYFLELVRYIHLNPAKAGLVETLDELATYPWSGHTSLLGTQAFPWHDTKDVLERFGGTRDKAVERYLAFVDEGFHKADDRMLEGGGLVRSLGGWGAVEQARLINAPMQADERILGSGDFVANVLRTLDEGERRRKWKKGRMLPIDVVAKAAKTLGVRMVEIQSHVKRPSVVRARQLACKWLVEDLGLSGTAIAKLLKISKTVVSRSAVKGVEVESALGVHLD